MKLLDYIYNCDDWNEIETNLQLYTFLLTTDQFDFNCDISSLRKLGIYCIYLTIEPLNITLSCVINDSSAMCPIFCNEIALYFANFANW